MSPFRVLLCVKFTNDQELKINKHSAADPNACAVCFCLGYSGPFVSDTSPKSIDREGLGESRTGTRQPSTQYAENDMKYLDRRYELLQTFRGTLYHPTNAEFPIKQQIAEKIAGSGISYQDLKNVFKKFGAKGLVGVLSLPPSSATSKAPRVTKTTRILARIVEHFKAMEETTS